MHIYTPSNEDIIKHIFMSLTGNIILNKTVIISRIGDNNIPKLAVSFSANYKSYKFNDNVTSYICAVGESASPIEKEVTLISEDMETIYIPMTSDITSNKRRLEATIKIVSEQGTIYSHPFTIIIN